MVTILKDPAVAAKDAFAYGSTFFANNPIGELVYFEKYSRWRDDLGRRETWPETVKRGVDYLRKLSDNRLSEDDYQRIHNAILNFHVLPSMRLLAMAGPAADRSHITLYNCAYAPIDSIDTFVEGLIISMSGTGFGYSVESQYVQQLPIIERQRPNCPPLSYLVPDSAEGWAEALRIGLTCWFGGYDVEFDFSLVRPAGAILRTKGGRSSGPDPLSNMLNFARNTILSKQGSRLSPLDAHDIMGNIALGAVSGGHRRSAMIALYDWDDQEMRHCKDGEYWHRAPWRSTANNSAVITDLHMDHDAVRDHFRSMVAGGNGEPGIFSRAAVRAMRPERRTDYEFGTNPCAEIALRKRQFCNLTEVILRPNDTLQTILEKTEIATIIGTIQSRATHFPGLRPEWKRNCEEERLLGVGFTGQMDCPAFQNVHVMQTCRTVARVVNQRYAEGLGINQSASITCVKPSGSTSLLTNASSGLHTRWAPYYERNIRVMASGPVAKTLLVNNAPMDPENGQEWHNADTYVVHFPMKAPDGAQTRNDRTVLEQLEYWKLCKKHLTEHNPSVTITYRPDEVETTEDWIIENLSILGGQAYLPHWDEDITLRQMPNREMTKAEYEEKVADFPVIDYSKVTIFETEDRTTSAQELACSAGLCETGA